MRADSAGLLSDLLDQFQAEAPREQLLSQLADLTTHFHLVAVAALLVDGNPEKWCLNLCRLAENGRRIARLLRHRKLAAPPPSATHTAVLAAIAASALPLARDVAAAANPNWDPDAGEYEDEARWANVFQALAQGAPASLIEQQLAAVEALEPEPYADRAAAVRALGAKDAVAFEKAFVPAHDIHAAAIDERAAAFGTPTTRFAPHRFVWLEGVALLRLAQAAGLPRPQAELRMCPALALAPSKAQYAGDWAIDAGQ